MSRRIALVTAGVGRPSSTRLLADRLGDAVRRSLESRGESVEVTVIEVRDHAHALVDAALTGFPSGDLATAVEDVKAADGLVVVTPTYNASYSGLFKTFFDVLDQEALAGKPVVVAATGGSARHSLVLDHALRPLFSYLRAAVVPTGVFAATEDFGASSDPRAHADLGRRIDRAADELAAAVVLREPAGPTDPFALTTSFEDLLAGG